MTVGLITNDSFGRFSFPIVEALEQQLADERHRGLHVQRHRRSGARAAAPRAVDAQAHRWPRGHRPSRRQAAARSARSCPACRSSTSIRRPMTRTRCCLVPDDKGGARLAVDHLIEPGPPAHRPYHRARAVRGRAAAARRAISHALAAAGLAGDQRLYLNGPWSEAWGRDAVARLFDGKAQRPDALFCGNDQMARGAIEALRERGIAVPGDVAIVGFDNWEVMTEAARPTLSSIDMNLKTLGREAGERAARHDRRARTCAACAACPAASSSGNSSRA